MTFLEAFLEFWRYILPVAAGLMLVGITPIWLVTMTCLTKRELFWYMPGRTPSIRKAQAARVRVLMWIITAILVIIVPPLWVLFPWHEVF